MEVLEVAPADIQVTFRVSLAELRKVVAASGRIEIRFNSGNAGEEEEKDALMAFLNDMKSTCDEIERSAHVA